MQQTQLFVTDNGDLSVGLPELIWVVDSPIFINDENNITADEMELLEDFRKSIIRLFQDFAEGRVTADYDFETIVDEDNY